MIHMDTLKAIHYFVQQQISCQKSLWKTAKYIVLVEMNLL